MSDLSSNPSATATGATAPTAPARALVLSGGAAKGAYELGALKRWLGEDGDEYDLLCGVSVGALNAAFLAQYPRGELRQGVADLEGLWRGISNDDVYRKWCGSPLSLLWQPSLSDSSPLGALVERFLDPTRVQSSGRLLRVIAVSWQSGKATIVNETSPNLRKWVHASASYPVFLSPVDIDGELQSDGGLRDVTPLGEAIKAGARDIDVVACSSPTTLSTWPTAKKRFWDYFLRAGDIMQDEIATNDIKVCGLKNDIARLDPSKYTLVRGRLVQPDRPLTDDALEFNQTNIAAMIDRGYADSAHPVPL